MFMHKIVINLTSITYNAGITSLKCTLIKLSPIVSDLGSLVVRVGHQHRTGVGLIPTEEPDLYG